MGKKELFVNYEESQERTIYTSAKHKNCTFLDDEKGKELSWYELVLFTQKGHI